MAMPSDLAAHYSTKAFQTRVSALTFVGVALAASIEHVDETRAANLVGAVLIFVVASLAELNRRYTHSYLCACHAASLEFPTDAARERVVSARWEVFRQTNERGWRRPWPRWLLSWSTHVPGLAVGAFLILRDWSIEWYGWIGLAVGTAAVAWWISSSRREFDLRYSLDGRETRPAEPVQT